MFRTSANGRDAAQLRNLVFGSLLVADVVESVGVIRVTVPNSPTCLVATLAEVRLMD